MITPKIITEHGNGVRVLDPNYDIDRHGSREKLSPKLVKFYEKTAQNKKQINNLFFLY